MENLSFVEEFNVNFPQKTLTVKVDSSITPQEIIDEVAKKGKIAVWIQDLFTPPPLQQEFDFDIEVAKDFRKQFFTLFYFEWVDQTYIDHQSGRLRIVVKPNYRPKPATILEHLKFHIQENVVKIRHIEPNDRFSLFSIKGLRDEKDAERAKKVLKSLEALVKQVHLNYSTRSVSILANVDDGKMNQFNQTLNTLLSQEFKEYPVELSPISLPSNAKLVTPTTPKIYFRRALWNALAALPFIFFGVPLPITLFGQVIGLLAGALTFGMMLKTGREFYVDAWNELTQRSSNMNTLIVLGTGSAFLYSMFILFAAVFLPGLFPLAALQYQFLAVNMILGIINFGHGIRVRAEEFKDKMVQNLSQIYAQNQPQLAKRVLNPEIRDIQHARLSVEEIPYQLIKEGDLLLVEPGEGIPGDGTIVSEKETNVEQSALTGEPGPIYKKKNDPVYGGSLNNKSAILVKATCDGLKGYLSQVLQDVDRASGQKPTISKLVDKIARIFVPTILIISLLYLIGAFLAGVAAAAMIQSLMALWLCACPCAMALSVIPISIGINESLNHRILVTDPTALELLAEVDVVVWDKTGTLTTPMVEDIFVGNTKKFTSNRIIQIAASVQKDFVSRKHDHPIAQSFINRNAANQFLHCDSSADKGQGIIGTVRDEQGEAIEVLMGSLTCLQANNVVIDKKYLDKEEEFAKKGMTAIYIVIGNECVSIVGLQHTLRNDAVQAIKDLKNLGIDVFMLTGDKKDPALNISRQLGILDSNVMYERNQEQKQHEIINLRDNLHRRVALIGDGINDLSALKEAHVPIAVGSWTSAAAKSKIALQRLNIGAAIIIARETMKNIRQNLYWTGAYNTISIIAAVLGYLNPVIASLCMAFSSVGVIINTMRLIFEMEEKIAMHEMRLSRSLTFFEKAKQFFSFQSLYRTIEMLLKMTHEDPTNPSFIVPKTVSTTMQSSLRKTSASSSPRPKRAQRNDVIEVIPVERDNEVRGLQLNK